MTFNWLAILGSGLVPMAVGALWYGPLFGKVWMKEADMSLEKIPKVQTWRHLWSGIII
ncbi:MAG: DUF1761 domain-containing protein [Saprospiraceae bacterium]|nr:DUF1761 domain-containing protein [Saprospiraceae bacterium]